ncbi:MAG: LPS-assembly protein LptD [Candidatus Rokubacteria bacterium]|nr:LPS-assembly protein LptD [Candidatus Rokubacteria bacterium]
MSVPTSGGDITVVADRIEQVGADGLIVATGNVEITRGSATLSADRVEINRETGDAVARGRVVFYDGEDRLAADRIDYNFRTGTGVVYDGEARAAPYYRVSGERLERIGESVYRVRRGIFTTCEADPPPWSFHVGSATADLNEFVYGTNASFWVGKIPLIPWIPFFAAAIRRERQTGFLFPKISTGSRKGLSTEIPFFWAISDSQDATIAPLMFERRGPGLNAEYRYVLSTDHSGTVKAFYVREAMREDDDRGWGAVRHDWEIGPRLTLKADTKNVTDDDVFRDYGDPLHQRSEQRAESNVFLSRRWGTWNLVGNAFWYQDLTTRRPTELNRLPEVTVTGVRQPVPGLPGLLWELSGGAVKFVRDVGSDGSRVDVNPRLSFPISAAGVVTITPFAGGRLTGYDRRVTGLHRGRDGLVTEETEDELSLRRLVETGFDVETLASRVYRPGRWGFEALLHSIEPRVNYTWRDGRGMDGLPFWTDVDRVEDSNRVEYSLTNRVRGRTVAPAGTEPLRFEVLRFLVGHSIDLKDSAQRSGDVVGDLIIQPTPKIKFRGNVRSDTHGKGIQFATTDLSVEIQRVAASVGTRYSDPQNVSFLQGALTAELTRNVIGRFSTNWDLRRDTFVENRYGVEVRFQCYSLTVEYVARSREAGHRGEDEIRFAVNLLGVGGPISSGVGLGSLTSSGGTSSR